MDEEPKPTLEVGQKVRIYFDAQTEQDYEGDATLLRREHTVGFWEGRVLARWVIRFRAESQKLVRIILEPKEEPKKEE